MTEIQDGASNRITDTRTDNIELSRWQLHVRKGYFKSGQAKRSCVGDIWCLFLLLVGLLLWLILLYPAPAHPPSQSSICRPSSAPSGRWHPLAYRLSIVASRLLEAFREFVVLHPITARQPIAPRLFAVFCLFAVLYPKIARCIIRPRPFIVAPDLVAMPRPKFNYLITPLISLHFVKLLISYCPLRKNRLLLTTHHVQSSWTNLPNVFSLNCAQSLLPLVLVALGGGPHLSLHATAARHADIEYLPQY